MTMPTDPPTLGEALRRLDAVSLQLQQVATLVATQADKNDAKYATKESVTLLLKPLADDVAELQDEKRIAAGFRRQIAVALIGVGAGALVSLVIGITGLLAGGLGGV